MKETINARITVAQKTEDEWLESDVVLLAGEIGVASDTQVIKVGNGEDVWKDLKSHQGEQGLQGLRGLTGSTGARGATGAKGDKGEAGSVIYRYVNSPEARVGIDYFLSDDGRLGRVVQMKDGRITLFGNAIPLKGEKGDKGDKGDPLRFEDLTPEQIEQLRAGEVNLSNYITRERFDDLWLGVETKIYRFETSVSYLSEGLGDVSDSIEYLDRHKADKVHQHTIADISGLSTQLSNKASSNHTHTVLEITGLQTELNNLVSTSLFNTNINDLGSRISALENKSSGPNVEVVPFMPSYPRADTLYLVRGRSR
ncbi:hyaluronate lyase N-terminal domain-containing protein [Dolosicoccus paucivorans]